MDCKNTDEPSNILKNPVKSSMKIGQLEGKINTYSNGLTTAANNTNPIICAVCGSKDYITLHLQDKGFKSDVLKKKMISTEFAQYGSLNPLTQAFFPHLSLFQFPNVYYSHYNTNFRFPSTPCMPIEKYYGDCESDASKGTSTANNSESTLFRGNKEPAKKKKTSGRVIGDSFRNEGCPYKKEKDESRPSSAYTNISKVRNFPMAIQPPFNFCPVIQYPYASLAFPVNQPLIPIYFPMTDKWQNEGTTNEEDPPDRSASHTRVGNASEGEKKEQKDETSEFDFEEFAREHMLDQKSNYDEDEEDEVDLNLDEIASSLKLTDVNSGREIYSEKFFNSKKKWNESKDKLREKDEIQNWRLSTGINMEDCCIRTLSKENFWFEAQDGEKKNRNFIQDNSWKEKHFTDNTKKVETGTDGDKAKIADGVFYETNMVWPPDRSRTQDESTCENHRNWKDSDRNSRRQKVTFGESSEITTFSADIKSDRSEMSMAKSKNEMEVTEKKIFPSTDSTKDLTKLSESKVSNDGENKSDVEFNNLAENTEIQLQTEKLRKMEYSSSGLSLPHPNIINEIKKDEKPTRSYGLIYNKYDLVKNPIPSQKKCKKPEVKSAGRRK